MIKNMRSKMKKTVAFVLITAMLCAVLPFSAIPAFAANNTVTDSQGVKYTLSYDGKYYSVTSCAQSATDIIIPGEINGIPVKEIGIGAFAFCGSLTSIVIPDSVTVIGEIDTKADFGPFSYCRSLKSIIIPDSVTVIGSMAFDGCTSLTSIVIGEGVTSISSAAFDGCTSLTDIIADADNSAYSSVNGILFNKNKTELICYPAGKAETTYVIPDSVTSIGDGAFEYCTSLESIVITDSVTSIGRYAFYYCSSLTSVVIGDSVTSIGSSAFKGCISLASIVIPEGVTSIGGWAFEGWTSNQTIYCCAESQPIEWNKNWASSCDAKIVWGYKNTAQYVKGDVDGDGDVDAIDYGLAKRYCLGTTDLTEEQIRRGDLNGNGTLEASEYGLIKRHVLGTYTIV